MINNIPPDDYIDLHETMKSLDEWIDENKHRVNPSKMAMILLITGSEIAHVHMDDQAQIEDLICRSLQLGIQIAYRYPEKPES